MTKTSSTITSTRDRASWRFAPRSPASRSAARDDVPESVLKAYGVARLSFGRQYLIPKPFDPRVLLWVAPAVAGTAMGAGVARRPIHDLAGYRESLERMLGPSRKVMHLVVHKAQQRPTRRLGFPRGSIRRSSGRRARLLASGNIGYKLVQHLVSPRRSARC